MLWLLSLAINASAVPNAQPEPARAVVQARASVRIISPVRVRFDGSMTGDAPPPSDSVIHADGAPQAARLIEFH